MQKPPLAERFLMHYQRYKGLLNTSQPGSNMLCLTESKNEYLVTFGGKTFMRGIKGILF